MDGLKATYIPHEIGDLAVVNNAKVSFGADNVSEWVIASDGSKSLSKKDTSLIDFLASGLPSKEIDGIVSDLATCTNHDVIRNTINQYKKTAVHWAPFAHEHVKVKMKAPIPIRTQAFKHKQGFVESECSMRYINSAPEIFIPEFRVAADNVKQGAGGLHECNDYWKDRYKRTTMSAVEEYTDMIMDGIAPETARFILPQGAIVNWIWTGNLASFARYYNQRTDPHAQLEGCILAKQVGDIISGLYPVSWAALTGDK